MPLDARKLSERYSFRLLMLQEFFSSTVVLDGEDTFCRFAD
jgi:hypothetical protein